MNLSKEEIKFRVRKTGAFTNLITDGYEDVAEYFEQLEAENAALKKTAGELAVMLWEATPPNEASVENAALKRYATHEPECIHWLPFAGTPDYIGCSCGLDALLTGTTVP